jgi:tetratricopeptide (TPR) repeat protein
MNTLRLCLYAATIACAPLFLGGCISLLPDFGPSSEINTRRLDRALEHDASNVHAHFLRGKAALESGEPEIAEEHFRRASELNPDFVETWEGLGVALLDQEQWKAAGNHYQEMGARFPDEAAAWAGLAAAHYGAGDITAMHGAAETALEKDARSAQALRLMGEAAYANRDYAEALDYWQRAVEADPELSDEYEPLIRDLRLYVERYREP